MEQFQSIFGIPQSSVQKNCLLMPFLAPQSLESFGVKTLSRGAVFSSASVEGLTIIKTGIGAGFVGDAVLYLDKTACENILFLGSCGLIDHTSTLKIGDIVIPTVAYGFESFCTILEGQLNTPPAARPDCKLMDHFLLDLSAHSCPAVSFASLHEEEKHIALFKQLKADVIEMECAALFKAAAKTKRRAIALLFIADILRQTRFYSKLSSDDQNNVKASVAKICHTILTFSSVINR